MLFAGAAVEIHGAWVGKSVGLRRDRMTVVFTGGYMNKILMGMWVGIFVGPLGISGAFGAEVKGSRELELTVYHQDLAMVSDIRRVLLSGGNEELKFEEITEALIPESVSLRFAAPTAVRILEQNYAYDLASPERLLESFVGKPIKLLERHEYQDRVDALDAVLLSAGPTLVYKIGEAVHIGHPGSTVLPKLPESVVTRPTLRWRLQTDKAGESTAELAYLTRGLGWQADYTLILPKEGSAAKLSAWATVRNESGKSFENTRLNLVAGTPNRVASAPVAESYAMAVRAAGAAMDGAVPARENLGDYHLYSLEYPVTLRNRQTQQVPFLEARTVALEESYEIRSGGSFYNSPGRRPGREEVVNRTLRFKNAPEKTQAAPLPEGTVRFYTEDSKGKLRFSGEDLLASTPVQAEVELEVGQAFDLKAVRTQVRMERLSTQKYRTDWEIRIRSEKKQKVQVRVIEPLYDQWKITASSHTPKPRDAQSVAFDVEVPPSGEAVLSYTVEVGV